jgi:DNA-binding HxlR family transcriptional regulator
MPADEEPRPPRPGRRVRGSRTGRPIMAALDLLGRRWALRLLWELRDGPLGARALRSRCDAMSSSVLYQRLRELEAAGLVGRDDAERYLLTPIGTALGAAIAPLDAWAREWARTSASADGGAAG